MKPSLWFPEVPELPWVPQNTAAFALRLLEFEASILLSDQDEDPFEYNEMPVSVSTALPSEGNHKRPAGKLLASDGGYLDSTTENNCGKVWRLGPGGKLQKTSSSSVAKASNPSNSANDNSSKLDKWGTRSDISGWGNLIVREKRTIKGAIKETQSGHPPKNAKPPRFTHSQHLESGKARTRQEHEQSPEGSNNVETMESDEDNSNASDSGHGNWELNFRPELDDSSSSEEDINDSDGSDDQVSRNFQDVNMNQNQATDSHGFNEVGGDSGSEEDNE